jgi:hypothetical protein
MVNFDRIKDRLLKGVYVGVGAFSASFVENLIEDNLGTGDIATAGIQMGVGLGASVGVGMVFDDPDSLPNDLVEFAGYGVQGAAFSNLAGAIQTGQSVGNSTVSVRARQPTGGGSSGTTSSETPFQADIA